MEDNRILLIGNGKTFIVNSIVKELTASGLEVVQAEPDINAISHIENRPKVYLLYIDDGEAMLDLYVYLRDRIIEEEFAIVAIGFDDAIDGLTGVISKSNLTASFARPINVKQIASKMLEVLEKKNDLSSRSKILVVDDDGTMLRTIKSWLDDKYQVYMVNSGTSAISFLARSKVDLILLDYEMPVTTGPQVLEMLRSEPDFSDIPVMFLTSKNDRESVMQVLSLKPEKYLLKTMPKAELVAAIDDFFTEQRARKTTTII